MEVEDARKRYEKELAGRASQHRYIAQAQKEAATRGAILPNIEAEVAWAKGCLDAAEGREVDWSKLRQFVKESHALTERQLTEARGW